MDVALICETSGTLAILAAFYRSFNHYEIVEVNNLGKANPKFPIPYALQLWGPRTIKSYWEDESLATTTDSIMGVYFEASAWIHYWDGQRFNTYWVAD